LSFIAFSSPLFCLWWLLFSLHLLLIISPSLSLCFARFWSQYLCFW
jgi:hypothetical protein